MYIPNDDKQNYPFCRLLKDPNVPYLYEIDYSMTLGIVKGIKTQIS